MKPDVLVAYPLRSPFMEELGQRYTLHRLDQADDRDALLEKAGPVCTAMVVNGHVTVDKALLDRLPALRLAACSSAGFDQMDLVEMTRRGIALTNTSDALVDEVANMAVLLALACQRRLVEADAYVRSGEWGRKGMFPLTPSTVGRRTGIVGLGNIGHSIARRCEALGHEIGYFGRSRKPVDYRFFDDLVRLADWADILIVATPGGAGTEGLVSAEVIRALGPEGTLVNVARGTVVDEAALIAALQGGKLGSAGIDVYLNEPTPDPALAALSNVILYPHHASGTVETRDRMARMALDNVDAFFAGQPLLTPVN
ncbi:2-hydroxyacid dehydrogenase [Paracoccus sp. CPCC 101403]|uniref:2-hydroxyacid dehydrogenase n=1 Tax=Paracoccus broussonetiae TaxID=3075834 RepID=A0ABU3EJ37_9RHOB|nr:2-hydroxyacid dehydrogenase [Paracoccus sp. CPCC 101403]MDT1064260.1 2-hydroxyacid dehydrogenase [Paracoccus sp. CPCC 101403]